MASALTFLVVFLVPLIIFFVNSGFAAKERRGIAAGIPKPKQPKAARPAKTPRVRTARVRSRRVDDCGRGFTHFALALVGSQEACKYCRYLEEVPSEPPGPADGGDSEETADNAPIPLVRPAND